MAKERDDIDTAINRYVDNFMTGWEKAKFYQRIKNDRDLRLRVNDYRRQRLGMRLLFASQTQSLTVAPFQALSGSSFSRTWSMIPQAMFAAFLLGAGICGGWSAAILKNGGLEAVSASSRINEIAQEGFRAHRVFVVERLHPVEVGRDEKAHLVKWLSNRMECEVSAPDFSTIGFELVGGRLLPSAEGPSGQLMYENSRGHRVTLYLRNEITNPSPGRRIERDGDLKAVIWSSGEMSIAAIGDAKDRQLTLLPDLMDS